MTENEFKKWYQKKYKMNDITFKEFMSENEILPCECNAVRCKGWAMISNHILFHNNKIKSNHFINLHMEMLNKSK